MEAWNQEYEAYLSSDKFAKWNAEFKKKEEFDPIRNDPDPEGWRRFLEACKDPASTLIGFAEKVGAANPKEATLQIKLLKFFITLRKGDLALTTI